MFCSVEPAISKIQKLKQPFEHDSVVNFFKVKTDSVKKDTKLSSLSKANYYLHAATFYCYFCNFYLTAVNRLILATVIKILSEI